MPTHNSEDPQGFVNLRSFGDVQFSAQPRGDGSFQRDIYGVGDMDSQVCQIRNASILAQMARDQLNEVIADTQTGSAQRNVKLFS